MTKEELKNKCTERAKIFQQAMKSCKSSSPMDCIEWFADRIAELEAQVDQLVYLHNEDVNTIKLLNEQKKRMEEELKADNDARKFAMAMSEKVEKQLRDENAQLKKEWQEQVQKATDEGYARTLQTIQLSKAKDIIKNLMVYVPVDLKEYEEAKQFLSEVEK